MLRRLILIVTLIFSLVIFTENIKATDVYSDGRIDTEFNKTGVRGAYANIETIIPTLDGKTLISGYSLVAYNGFGSRIIKINDDGTPDNSFYFSGSNKGSVKAIAFQSDGKLLVGYYSQFLSGSAIDRYNSDVSLDNSFNQGGGGALGGTGTPRISSIVMLEDGKILIGGNFTTYNGVSRSKIARLNSDGSLDESFDPGSGASSSSFVLDIEVLPDGKLVVVGSFTTYDGVTVGRIVRLNSDGSLDATFNVGGGGANNSIYDISLVSDNKLIISGDFTTFNGTGRNRIAKLNTDGSLDGTFNPGTGANSTIYSQTIQSDGKILIVGRFSTYNGTGRNRVARVNESGSLDTSFNPGTGADNDVYEVFIKPGGKILLGGGFDSFNSSRFLRNFIQLNNDGSIDNAFNSDATGDLGYSGGWDLSLEMVKITADNKILVAGSTHYNEVLIGYISRLNSNGTFDDSFNTGGIGTNGEVKKFVVQDDNKIVIVGEFTSFNGVARNRIARLNSDGSLDTSFDPGTGANNTILSVVIQNDGKLIIGGGFTTYNATSSNYVARLNSNGSIDSTFNIGVGFDSWVESIYIDNNSKVIVGGWFTTYNGVNRNYVTRINTDGSLDTSFNPGTGTNDGIAQVYALDEEGILITGYFTSYNGVIRNRIAKLENSGSLDLSFDSGVGANESIESLAIQNDGKIVIGGYLTKYNGISRKKIARINTDGSLDMSFDPALGGNTGSQVDSIVIDSEGGFIISGSFTSYNDYPATGIIRLGLPDVEAPTGSISINSDALYTTNSNVSLTLNAIDTYSGLKEMMVCSNSSFEGCGWESYTGSKPWVFDSNLGTKTLYVKYKDNEDNVSEVYSDSIELYNLVVRITDIGLIDDVPDREDLYYYFTSQRVVIQGETKSNSTVYFTYDNETYTTTSDLEGEYSITSWVDMGTNSISYYAEDESGNESPTRTLTLIVGTEYFPDWLLIKLGILPEIDEEEEVIEEEIVEEEEEEEDIVIPEIEEETNTPIQIIGFDGDPLRDIEILFDDVSYITDGEGYIYVIDVEAGSHIVKLKINEEEYSQLLVLGEDDLKGGSIVRFEYEKDYSIYVIVGCISLILMTSISMIIYRRRGINKG